MRRRVGRGLGLCWAGLACGVLAGCEPGEVSRGWECIAPANAGGGWDLTCRAVGQVLSDAGLSPGLVRTTNVPGAGGGVAYARTVAQRADDPNVLVDLAVAMSSGD